jgi:hypothetical protein
MCPIRMRSVKSAQQLADAPGKSTVAQGKPVARRGRKARDLSETARLPTEQIRRGPRGRSRS